MGDRDPRIPEGGGCRRPWESTFRQLDIYENLSLLRASVCPLGRSMLSSCRPTSEACGFSHAEQTREAEARAEVHGSSEHHRCWQWWLPGAYQTGPGDGPAQSEVRACCRLRKGLQPQNIEGAEHSRPCATSSLPCTWDKPLPCLVLVPWEDMEMNI